VIQRLPEAYFAEDVAPAPLPYPLKARIAILILYVKMELVFRLQVQDGAAVLIKNSLSFLAVV
jgi:hypothetical protein